MVIPEWVGALSACVDQIDEVIRKNHSRESRMKHFYEEKPM
jgi:hypothetical protein